MSEPVTNTTVLNTTPTSEITLTSLSEPFATPTTTPSEVTLTSLPESFETPSKTPSEVILTSLPESSETPSTTALPLDTNSLAISESSLVSPTPISTVSLEVLASETSLPPVLPGDEILTNELVVNLGDVHTTVIEDKPSDVDTTVVESTLSDVNTTVVENSTSEMTLNSTAPANETTSITGKEPSIKVVVLPSVKGEDKVTQDKSESGNTSSLKSPKSDSGEDTSQTINPQLSDPDISTGAEPSKSNPVVPTNGATRPPTIPGTGNLGRPTIRVPLVDSSKEASSQVPAMSTATTMTLLLSFGVALLLVALAFFIIRKSRRARLNDAAFNQGVDWQTSSGGNDLEKGGSTYRTSIIPRADWTILHGAADSEKWGLTRDSRMENEDTYSIDSTISSDSAELAFAVQEAVPIAVPPQFPAPSAHISLVRPHSYFAVPSAKLSPVRPRSFFDNNRLMPLESPFLSPLQDGIAKEAEDERMRRW